METSQLEALVKDIVKQATGLKDKYTQEKNASVNYACIFSHSQKEYHELMEATGNIGEVVDNTKTGPVFKIKQIDTVSGKLRVLKIRIPDETRPERGDADFTVADYTAFKTNNLDKPNFKLIEREKMEMMELSVNGFNVRAYFSNPTLGKVLGI